MKLIIEVNTHNHSLVHHALGYGGFIGCEHYPDMCTAVIDYADFEDLDTYDDHIKDIGEVIKALIASKIKFTVEYQ